MWKPNMSGDEAAQVIERFLEGCSLTHRSGTILWIHHNATNKWIFIESVPTNWIQR